jgi:hypothetical protein
MDLSKNKLHTHHQEEEEEKKKKKKTYKTWIKLEGQHIIKALHKEFLQLALSVKGGPLLVSES